MILIYYIDQKLQLSLTTKVIYGGVIALLVYLFIKYRKNNQNILYIKVYKNRLIIRHIIKKLESEQLLKEPLDSSINLVKEQYTNIEAQLKEEVNRHFKNKWYMPRPIVFIHAMGTQEGELSEKETDLFKELAFSVGGGKVFTVTGSELNDEFLHESSKET